MCLSERDTELLLCHQAASLYTVPQEMAAAQFHTSQKLTFAGDETVGAANKLKNPLLRKLIPEGGFNHLSASKLLITISDVSMF